MYCRYCGKITNDDECECFYDDIENDWDEEDEREEAEERRLEELAERAALCKCGAWQFNSKGDVVHVADCCCGAE